jgi:hypothetical protein
MIALKHFLQNQSLKTRVRGKGGNHAFAYVSRKNRKKWGLDGVKLTIRLNWTTHLIAAVMRDMESPSSRNTLNVASSRRKRRPMPTLVHVRYAVFGTSSSILLGFTGIMLPSSTVDQEQVCMLPLADPDDKARNLKNVVSDE